MRTSSCPPYTGSTMFGVHLLPVAIGGRPPVTGRRVTHKNENVRPAHVFLYFTSQALPTSMPSSLTLCHGCMCDIYHNPWDQPLSCLLTSCWWRISRVTCCTKHYYKVHIIQCVCYHASSLALIIILCIKCKCEWHLCTLCCPLLQFQFCSLRNANFLCTDLDSTCM